MTNKTSPKTPYEIRLDLLNLAQSVLIMKHEAESEAEAKAKLGGGERYRTTSPSTEEIIAEAEKMNLFVSKANQSH